MVGFPLLVQAAGSDAPRPPYGGQGRCAVWDPRSRHFSSPHCRDVIEIRIRKGTPAVDCIHIKEGQYRPN